MEILLVAEGTYPHVRGGVSVWCDQMIRGLRGHRFHVVALTATGREPAVYERPQNVVSVRSLPIWTMRRPAPQRRIARRPDPSAAIALLDATLSHAPEASEQFESALFELFFQARRLTDLGEVLRTDTMAKALATFWHRFHDGAPDLRLADALAALDLIEHALRPLAFQPPDADVTHTVSNGLAALVGLAAKWTHGTPLIIAEHGVYLRERYLALGSEQLGWPVKSIVAAFTRRLCETGYRNADLITPCNEYNQRWEKRLGADPAKLRTVYNGVDPERFPPAESEPDEPTLVFVGRIDPLKDLHTLLRAFALVLEELPAARLRLFGGAPPGGEWYLEECLALVKQLGIERAVVFEGPSSAVSEAYAAGQVVVLSSISEGLPFTVLEAMACGRPNVGTDVGGVGEAIGDTGLVVPPRKPSELAQACLTLLTDHDRRRALGLAARERALELFTITRAVDTFDEIYRTVAMSATYVAPPAKSGAPSQQRPLRTGLAA
ncbi:MAG TPA: GT4 family glycosyltransferase PelF [Actinocrinis sp.]|uniref:GT4 family glycosyltransferase PelF n=1 Tax=Actinocrinis sp. TaxID=1920516 RepID=UPI002DDCD1A1|nr:GT4 family glycosyltransferase PelF [Actinocrinis sp.]HEV2347462.1 GT4 family glycosyltransferase PelF [Actinocrinis sp.]